MGESKKNLSNQFFIYSVDTSAFYNKREQQAERNYYEYKKSVNDDELREQLKELRAELKQIKGRGFKEVKKSLKEKINQLKSQLKVQVEKEDQLKKELKEELTLNKEQRKLNPTHLNEKNVIALFESTLSRTLGIENDSISTDIIVVQTYYFSVLKELIRNGFTYLGEAYTLFTASAGQIRKKKCIFIRKSVWKEHKETLTCGLSKKNINKKGGVNINKYLAYLALSDTATVKWEGFDINKCIVVDDMETSVRGYVDYINNQTFKISSVKMKVPIMHTDGCGIMLPTVSKKAFMFRAPWIKGLLVPMNFKAWVDDAENKKKGASTKIEDIDGKTWDIVEDGIQIIFTRSMFKMHSYYSNWQEYKDNFIKYNCQAGKCNEEEDEFTDARLTYQILQTLIDMSDDELIKIAEKTNKDIELIGSDKNTILRVLGAKKKDEKKNYFQKALSLYPELINDTYSKEIIKQTKKAMVKEARAGKLRIEGSYTFLIPDLVAFCEWLFCGIKKPKGLLANSEVFCSLYENGKELDALRSPHLFKEHCPRTNVIDEQKKKWFIAKGIYTSSHDLISKVLQFDNDGDMSLVVSDSTIVSVAQRNMNGILPLYYKMSVAKKQKIGWNNIYTSLTSAFKVNIGEISNAISKVFNNSDREKIDLDVVKWLCFINNELIDFAKTLHMSEQPPEVKEKIKSATSGKLPSFFIYAKNKKPENVEDINDSTVNRLEDIVTNKRICFEDIPGNFNYKKLMKNSRVKLNTDDAVQIINLYDKLNRSKKWILKDGRDQDKNVKYDYVWKHIREQLLEKEKNKDAQYVTDVLIKLLFAERDSDKKETLWECFGDVIIENLEKNLNGTIQCLDCGDRVKKTNNKRKFCDKCAQKRNKSNKKESKEKAKNRKVESA